ncbi:MAG: ankyrin repeat domain-containing protein [Thermomicrobiales bacterium]|nr:ankyrin repeat domain-containing protein [Thermomicrobiales bacterium]
MSTSDAATLFAQSIADDDLAAVRRAIANGADIEARNASRQTPLVVATKAGRTAIAIALLEAGADPNAKDDLQDSAYLYAGAEGLDDILERTLAFGADLTSTNRYGGTALIPACERGHVETVKTLLAAGVAVNHVNKLDWTALHEAIVLGDGSDRYVDVVRLLLAAGADAAIPDGEGVLPRQLAADRGYAAIVAEIDKHASA